MQSRVEGEVELEAVIERDGSVSEVRIVKPLVDDLDRQAEKAVRHWRFDPARLHGTPVRTRASVLLWFTLK
jgi:protein TonB